MHVPVICMWHIAFEGTVKSLRPDFDFISTFELTETFKANIEQREKKEAPNKLKRHLGNRPIVKCIMKLSIFMTQAISLTYRLKCITAMKIEN